MNSSKKSVNESILSSMSTREARKGQFRYKPLSERNKIYLRLIEQHPGKIPILVYADKKSNIPQCENEK